MNLKRFMLWKFYIRDTIILYTIFDLKGEDMIPPRKISRIAKEKEDENFEFRTFLKMNAEEEDLDQRFLRLHNEMFAKYDCSRCRNCCKMFHGAIPVGDIEQDAEKLNVTKEQFMEFFLASKTVEGEPDMYQTKHKPCDFLQEDGDCKLGDCKPANCIKYPYTNQPHRLESLFSVLDAVSVCPVAFEIFEQLKEEYGFKGGRRH